MEKKSLLCEAGWTITVINSSSLDPPPPPLKKRADLDFAQNIFLFYKALLLPRPRTVYLRSTLAWTFLPVGFFTKARKSHVNSMQNQEKEEKEEEDHKEGFTEYSKATTVVRKCRR